MSENPGEILYLAAYDICSAVLEELDVDMVESVFLSGSIAEKRVAFFKTGDHIEFYSDLDLYFVVTSDLDLETAKRTIRGVAARMPLKTDRYTMFSPPDVGVYTETDLLGQPARPGTVDIFHIYRLLYGREDVAQETERFQSQQIQREEALYLLEHRILEGISLEERLKEEMSDGYRRFVTYSAFKACLDVVTAILIFEGRYTVGLVNRMQEFQEVRTQPLYSGILDLAATELIDFSWTSIRDLQIALSQDQDQFSLFRSRITTLLLRVWRGLAMLQCGKREPVGWDELIRLRCSQETQMQNLRETMRLMRRLGYGKLTAGRLWMEDRDLNPRDMLRLSGLTETLKQLDLQPGEADEGLTDTLERYLSRLTETCGFSKGSLFERARDMYDAIM